MYLLIFLFCPDLCLEENIEAEPLRISYSYLYQYTYKLSPVVFFFFLVLFSVCSFDAIINVTDNSWKHCDPLYICMLLLFLLYNKNN